MTRGLVRYHHSGNFHFITFCCYHRLAYFDRVEMRDLFELSLEPMRQKYQFVVVGYVVMPEHVHLLISEPKIGTFDRAIQAVKLSVTQQQEKRPFWQARYYDFNVFTTEKTTEKLRYMHRNPVVRGLVEKPEEWKWSSFRHYATGVEETVEIESFWTAPRRGGELPGGFESKRPVD